MISGTFDTAYASKLIRPRPASTTIDRPRLYHELDRWRSVRAIVVQAAAGYGKSVLVSRWLDVADCEAYAAWLSLDESDNDPWGLVGSITRAFETVLPGVSALMQPVLNDSQGTPQRAMTKLIAYIGGLLFNQNGTSAPHQLLVLDNLHVLASSDVVSLLVPLLETAPPNLHVVLLTRSSMPLPLPRLYADRQLVELTTNDLCFTTDETSQYLVSHRVSASPREVEQLRERTEGWVLAMQLAMRSQRGHDSLGVYLSTLRGDGRWLAQYLTQEVLDGQSAKMRKFLLHTSILESFSAPLSEAITGVSDAYQLLAQLQQNELFVIELEDNRGWFRYHHLFQELLQQQLLQVEDAATINRLHRRAADWLAHNDRLLEATRHLLDAGAEDDAGALVEKRVRDYLIQEPLMAQRLFEVLPPHIAMRRSRLMLDRCLLAIMIRNTDLNLHIHNAQRALADNPAPQSEQERLNTELLVYQASAHFAAGEITSATVLAKQVKPQIAILDTLVQGVFEFLLMHLYRYTANDSIVHDHAQRALAAFNGVNYMAGVVAVRREMAKAAINSGRSADASQEFARIEATIRQFQTVPVSESGTIYLSAAEHCYWQNQIEQAVKYQKMALEIVNALQDDEWNYFLTFLYYIYSLRMPASLEAVQSLDKIEWKSRVPGPTWWHEFTDWQIRYLLAMGQPNKAWIVAIDYRASLPNDLTQISYRRLVPYIRAYIARGIDLAGVKPVMDYAMDAASVAQDYPKQLEFLAFRAWAEVQNGKEDAAEETLTRAKELVDKTGYVRVLLDIPALKPLLRAAPWFDDEAFDPSPAEKVLTDKEQTILLLLAEDLTYGQIAEKLVISINTVRTHIRHVYDKLGVKRRDQAVARARRLGLIL